EGIVVPAQGEVAVRQVLHAVQCQLVLCVHKRQRLFVKRDRIGVLAEGRVGIGQVVHARKRVGVVAAQLDFREFHRLFGKGGGLGGLVEGGIGRGQVAHAP